MDLVCSDVAVIVSIAVFFWYYFFFLSHGSILD